MQTDLERYIVHNARLTDATALAEIACAFKVITLKKNDFLVRKGDICPYFCYVESGILQHSISVEGDEKTTYLAMRDSATSSLLSFINRSPSRKDIKAIAETKIRAINRPAFQILLDNNDLFRRFYYNLLERQICLIDDYRIDLLTMTAEERYQKLLANDKVLLQSVPLRYLASFLGISMRNMSRIRNSVK